VILRRFLLAFRGSSRT